MSERIHTDRERDAAPPAEEETLPAAGESDENGDTGAAGSEDDLERRLADTRQELFNLRFQSATGALENSARVKLAKREIARILTVRLERADSLRS